MTMHICRWCQEPADRPGRNSRGEPCRCPCHVGYVEEEDAP
jgi:hypothetical protein